MKSNKISTKFLIILGLLMLIVAFWLAENAPIWGVRIGEKLSKAGANVTVTANVPEKQSPPVLYYEIQFTASQSVLYTNNVIGVSYDLSNTSNNQFE